MEKWKILHSRLAFHHHWYTVRQDTVQLPDGKIVEDYFVSVRRDVVLIFAVTADQMVPLVRQYKHGVQKILLELPGGFVDEGETPENAAARELFEETGYVSENLQLLTRVHDNPTKDTNTLNLFLAPNAFKHGKQTLDQTEDIAVELVPLHQVWPRVIQGDIPVSGSISTIVFALERLERIKMCDG